MVYLVFSEIILFYRFTELKFNHSRKLDIFINIIFKQQISYYLNSKDAILLHISNISILNNNLSLVITSSYISTKLLCINILYEIGNKSYINI